MPERCAALLPTGFPAGARRQACTARVLRATLAAAASLALVLLAACSRDGQPDPAAPAAPPVRDTQPDRELPNIIVYLVDTLRADHLGLYGAQRDTSPDLDRFAGTATTFDMAVAQAPWTLPSVTSLHTSTYPPSHQILSDFDKVGPQATTMAEFFHELGYHTLGFVANTLGGKGAGLDQGYDEFFEQPAVRDLTPEQIAAGALSMKPLYEWARTYDGKTPVFCWIHTVEPHNPYEGAPRTRAPFFTGTPEMKAHLNDLIPEQAGLITRRNLGLLKPGQAERLDAIVAELAPHLQDVRDLYDGDVRQANDNFQRLVAMLSHRPRWEETVVVFLADHGEELYDHGNWGHGQSLFQEIMRVPLIVRLPGAGQPGRRIAQPVELIDVLPTLADFLGVDPLPDWQGHSLLPLLRGGAEDPAAPVFSMRISVDRKVGGERGDRETALVQDGWKLVVHHDTQRTSLYDLRADPLEQHELSAEQPERLSRLMGLVKDRLRSLPKLPIADTGPEDPDAHDEKLQNLIELGYVAGKPQDGK